MQTDERQRSDHLAVHQRSQQFCISAASIVCNEFNYVQSDAKLVPLICSYVNRYFSGWVHLHVSPAPVPVWGLLPVWWGAMQPVPLRDLSTCPPGRPSTHRLLRSSSHRCAATRPVVAKEAAAPPADQRTQRWRLKLWTFSIFCFDVSQRIKNEEK